MAERRKVSRESAAAKWARRVERLKRSGLSIRTFAAREGLPVGSLSRWKCRLELLGLPFALFPARIPGVGHQTDRRLAADCVALVVYGRRRLGEPVGYIAPLALRRHLTHIGSAQALVRADGSVADVGPVREGDVLDFGFQTAVLARDMSLAGKLDPDDIVIHSYHGLVEEVPLRRLPYRHQPVEVLRWPASSSRGANSSSN